MIIEAPRKAVIPVGLSRRCEQESPNTLPQAAQAAVERLLVRRAVEEALASGFEELVFVTQEGMAIVEGHPPAELEPEGAGPDRLIGRPAAWGPAGWPRKVLISRHGRLEGLGHALWGARKAIGLDPFALLVPSHLIAAAVSAIKQVVDRYREQGGNVVAVADAEVIEREGAFAAIIGGARGRYVLQPDVFEALERQESLDLKRAILAMAEVWPLSALPLAGRCVDRSSHAAVLEAQLAAAPRTKFEPDFVDHILQRCGMDRPTPGRPSMAAGLSGGG